VVSFWWAVRTFKRPDQKAPLSTIEDSSPTGSITGGERSDEEYDEKKIDASRPQTTSGTIIATTELRD